MFCVSLTSLSLLFSCALFAAVRGRIAIIVPNTFESHQLVCPPSSFFGCAFPDLFVLDRTLDVSNHRFYEGYIGCPSARVVVVTTGLATINTAMTTQLLITYYEYAVGDPIEFIINYGIAGGMDDSLEVGDVVVASKWVNYNLWSWQREGNGAGDELPLEAFGDYTRDVGYFSLADGYNNVWFQPQEVFNETAEERNHVLYFEPDPSAMSVMRRISSQIEANLSSCDASNNCLSHLPVLLVGGGANGDVVGLTADIFVDNIAFRQMLFNLFHGQSIEMETGAVAMVAVTNNIPFIAFRSLSDLAGGGSNITNEADIFFSLAVHNSITVLSSFMDAFFCANVTPTTAAPAPTPTSSSHFVLRHLTKKKRR